MVVYSSYLGSKSDNSDFSISRQDCLFFLFYDNVSVWFAHETENDCWTGWQDVPVDKWQNVCNHNRNWPLHGIESALIKTSSEITNNITTEAKTKEEDHSTITADINISACLGIGNLWDEVIITHKAQKANSYFRDLVEIELTE